MEASQSMLQGHEIQLDDFVWKVGPLIGSGGIGRVYEAIGSAPPAVLKFVPKQPGADRELLFADIADTANVVPVIQTGSYESFYVIAMPRATRSLREYYAETAETVSFDEVLDILLDITTALRDLDGRVVHRDLKPENILYFDGKWCITDFGISRFAAASTATHTHKFSMTPQYAAPEQWRWEHATTATDVYSLGVMAYELFSGQLPFAGPAREDFREQHLHKAAPPLKGVPKAVAALIDECLYKAPEARPAPTDLFARLSKLYDEPRSPAFEALAAADFSEVQRRAEADRAASRRNSHMKKKQERQGAARASMARISEALLETITDAAPTTDVQPLPELGWSISLASATLTLSPLRYQSWDWGPWTAPAFEVDSATRLELTVPFQVYEGRSHSLWFGDIQQEGAFGWFETSFMSLSGVHRGQRNPFALDPGPEANEAISNVVTPLQVAWPFTRLDSGDLDAFVERWSLLFAKAASGNLAAPSSLPEQSPRGTWRLT